MKNKQKRKGLVKLSDSRTLIELSGSSKMGLLAEKFLAYTEDKIKGFQKTLLEQKRAQKRFDRGISIASMMPLLIIPAAPAIDVFVHSLLDREWACRAFFVVFIGISLALPALYRRSYVSAARRFGSGLLLFRLGNYKLYSWLLGSAPRRATIEVGYLIILALVFYALAAHFKGTFFPIPFKNEELSEVKKMIEATLAQENEIRGEELSALIRDYAPELTQMQRELRLDDPEELVMAPPTSEVRKEEAENMSLPMYLGYNFQGAHRTVDLSQLPHLLIGGRSQMGKSNLLRNIIDGLIDQNKARLVLIDPEQVEFAPYDGVEGVEFIGNVEDAKTKLDELRQEMDRRQSLFLSQGCVKINDYKGEMKRVVLVVDEYVSFSNDSAFVAKTTEIARLGRKYGVHLIIATQRPDAKTLDAQLRANMGATIALGVRDASNARILLAPGAELIKAPGQFYFVWGDQELIQAPLARKIKEAKKVKRKTEEVSSPQGEETSLATSSLYAPSSGDQEGAIFIKRDELAALLGGKPEDFGFTLGRRMDPSGARKRGFWVKKTVSTK